MNQTKWNLFSVCLFIRLRFFGRLPLSLESVAFTYAIYDLIALWRNIYECVMAFANPFWLKLFFSYRYLLYPIVKTPFRQMCFYWNFLALTERIKTAKNQKAFKLNGPKSVVYIREKIEFSTVNIPFHGRKNAKRMCGHQMKTMLNNLVTEEGLIICIRIEMSTFNWNVWKAVFENDMCQLDAVIWLQFKRYSIFYFLQMEPYANWNYKLGLLGLVTKSRLTCKFKIQLNMRKTAISLLRNGKIEN